MQHLARVDSICGYNFGEEGDSIDTANTISSSINMDNIETGGTGIVSSRKSNLAT